VFNLDPNCSGPYFIIDLAENFGASLELRKILWKKLWKRNKFFRSKNEKRVSIRNDVEEFFNFMRSFTTALNEMNHENV
jgi:hypothetical protein